MAKCDAKMFVECGYGDVFGHQGRSLGFKTECLEPEDIIPAIRQIKSYNNFKGKDVAAAVSKVAKEVDCVSFGRENSPVLYLTVRQNRKGERAEKVRKIFKPTRPDEFHYDDLRRSIRMWWD